MGAVADADGTADAVPALGRQHQMEARVVLPQRAPTQGAPKAPPHQGCRRHPQEEQTQGPGEARPRLVEIILGPPPEKLWKEHELRRIEYYNKFEQTAPLRDWVVPWSDIEVNSVRLTALPGTSNLIWELVLGPQDERRTYDFYETVKIEKSRDFNFVFQNCCIVL